MKSGLVLRSVAATAIVLGSAFPAAAAVYPWNLPANVRIVQKDSANARTFTTVKAALDSLAGCSAAKRCLVKVMPGTYAIPAGGLVLKQYVDIEGSGAGLTVISGSVAAGRSLWGDLPADQGAVVRMAANSWLRDLTVRNTSAQGGIAIFFNGMANAGAERINAETLGANGTAASFGYDYHAVHVQGAGANVTLDGVAAKNQMSYTAPATLYGENVVIGNWGGTLVVKNSRATATNGVYNVGIVSSSNGTLTLQGSVIEVGGETGQARGIMDNGQAAEISASTVKVTCSTTSDAGCGGIYGISTTVVRHANVTVSDVGGRTNDSVLHGAGSIAASGLIGPDIANTWTIVNCWNESWAPLP